MRKGRAARRLALVILRARDVAAQASAPSLQADTSLYVLDADGTLLHSQRTDVLEFRSTYSQEAWLAFIDRWAAAP